MEVLRGGGSACSALSAIGGTSISSHVSLNTTPLRSAISILSMGGTSATDNNTELNASIISSSHKWAEQYMARTCYRVWDMHHDGTAIPSCRDGAYPESGIPVL